MLTTGYEQEGFVEAGLKPALPNNPNPSCPEPEKRSRRVLFVLNGTN